MNTIDTEKLTATSGEPFTDSARLAALVLRRFGGEIDAAASAWRRLLGNTCSDAEFAALAAQGHEHSSRSRWKVALVREIDALSDEACVALGARDARPEVCWHVRNIYANTSTTLHNIDPKLSRDHAKRMP